MDENWRSGEKGMDVPLLFFVKIWDGPGNFLFPAFLKDAIESGMSDETTPKFRLRPKLAGGPPAATPIPPPPPLPPPVEADSSDESSSEPMAVWPEAKPAATRPKLALKPDATAPTDEGSGSAKPAPLNDPAPVPPTAERSVAFPPPAPVKPVLVPRAKPTLSPAPVETKGPADTGATPPFVVDEGGEKKLPAVLNAPPPPKIKVAIPVTETWPAVLDAPPPPGLAPVPVSPKGAEAEPAEITAIRKASTFPFPAPTAKFPPLPGLSTSAGSEPPESTAPERLLKKLLLIGGLVLLLLAGGAVFAYFKFFAKPAAAPVPAAVRSEPTPAPAGSKVKQMMDKVQQEQQAPLNEVVAADPSAAPANPVAATTAPGSAPASTVETAVVPAPEAALTPPPVPVKPPPPPPSLAFKAWVANLKIRGVRGGEAQRVFIDKTSYVPGDVVNPQLGITFVGYDEETRLLKFQDKTGATFERRH